MKGAFEGLLTAMLIAVFGCSGANTLKVGTGETVITPKQNMQMAGFARSQVSTGVHDDLHARSLVVEDTAGKTAALKVL